jgi:hypothetical protein
MIGAMDDTTRKHRTTMYDATPTRLVPALAIAVAMAVGAARADDRAPHAPPPEIFNACEGRQAGSACSMTFGDRTVQGTCAAAPDARLACRPGAPPPLSEAVAACEAKQVGDGCSVAFGPLTMSGTCAAVEDGRLACRPSGPPRR